MQVTKYLSSKVVVFVVHCKALMSRVDYLFA